MNKLPEKSLTAKELIILSLLSKGLLYKEMSAMQKVNINTIKKHCKTFIQN